MFAKKLLLSAIALSFLMSAGCCRFWDRVCHGGPTNYQQAPYCCPPPPCCPTPGGAVPVPSAPPGNWCR